MGLLRRHQNSATWPFAELHATREQVAISAPAIGTFVVTHGNLASITPFGRLPVLASGLRFEAYLRQQVAVFWTFSRSAVLAELADRGWNLDPAVAMVDHPLGELGEGLGETPDPKNGLGPTTTNAVRRTSGAKTSSLPRHP